MKHILFALTFFFLLDSFLTAQDLQYNKTQLPQISKFKTINLGDIESKYNEALISIESPNVSGKSNKVHLRKIKESLKNSHPKQDSKSSSFSGSSEPPEVIESFFLLNSNTGIPIDNHIAMSSDTLVCVGNSFVSIQKSSGSTIRNFSLANFASALNLPQDISFDPRVLFDPASQRYVLIFLAGFDSSETNIITCFSATKDPLGEWHCYRLPGNPNEDLTWTDYPMISYTETDIFITANLLRDNESWQLGFEESVIWQIPKENGYNGEELDLMLWGDIRFDGKPIRNLCPVESATEAPLQSMQFLSNRNFSIETDSFFLLNIDGPMTAPETSLSAEMLPSFTPYGVPPNADQEVGQLQTNDARVLEAFILQDEIHFVGNTRNLDNNKAGIYHGIIEDSFGAKNTSLTHIIGEDYELGYPGLVYTGNGLDERDLIIAFNHTSTSRFAGVSAMYYHPIEGYSEIISIREGQSPVTAIDGDLQRWGDYLGTQRDYDNPDEVWISGFVGGGRNIPHVSNLRKPGVFSSTQEQEIQANNVFPNPANDWISIDLAIPYGTDNLKINLLDINGQLIDIVFDSRPRKTGKSVFTFSTSNLSSGTYLLQVSMDQNRSSPQKIIVH